MSKTDPGSTAKKRPSLKTRLYRWGNCRRLHPQWYEFLHWQEGVKGRPAPKLTVQFSTWRKGEGAIYAGDKQVEEYHKFESGALNGSEPIDLIIDSPHEIADGKLSHKAPIRDLTIQRTVPNITIHNTRIDRIVVNGVRSLAIRDCFIGKLAVKSEAKCEFDIADSLISVFSADARCLRSLVAANSAFFHIDCAAIDDRSPFVGPVVFHRLYLPRDRHEVDTNVQMLRNARLHLQKMGNTLAAGPFHSAELALERETDSRVNQAWSWMYEVISDYGNSTGRPMASFLLYYFITALVIFFSDGVTALQDHTGWQASLEGTGLCGELYRASFYPLLSVLNPLSVFGYRPLLVPSSPIMFVVLLGLGAWGLLSIVLLVFGLRRRFKI